MPFYNYRCTACGKELELLRPMRLIDAPIEDPCTCGEGTWQRRISKGMSFDMSPLGKMVREFVPFPDGPRDRRTGKTL